MMLHPLFGRLVGKITKNCRLPTTHFTEVYVQNPTTGGPQLDAAVHAADPQKVNTWTRYHREMSERETC